MRILLQQKDSGLYFKGLDAWVRNSLEALDFVSSTAAIEYCAQAKLADVQLVLKFEEERCAIVLPFQACAPLSASQPALSAHE
jgi:hypothetical protein